MLCEKCNKQHSGTFGSGRFCSRSCANSRTWSREDRLKKSITAKSSVKVLEANANRTITKAKNYTTRKVCLGCGNSIDVRNKIGYCLECLHMPGTYTTLVHCGIINKWGGYREGSGRSKGGRYKGIRCDSSWELAFLVYNLDHELEIARNTEAFEYVLEGSIRRYTPDFIVDNILYEIKGYYSYLVDLKASAIPKNRKYFILYRDDMQTYINYVKSTYNITNLIDLYDDVFENICEVCGKVTKHYVKPSAGQGCCRKHTCMLRIGQQSSIFNINDGETNFRISKDVLFFYTGHGYCVGRLGKVNQYT